MGGWIGAAFFLVGAPAAILMGYYSHAYNRCTMFFWVVILGQSTQRPCRSLALAVAQNAAFIRFNRSNVPAASAHMQRSSASKSSPAER